MDETSYNICDETLEENITLKNNNSVPINSCSLSYTNHTDLYLERESEKLSNNLKKYSLNSYHAIKGIKQ